MMKKMLDILMTGALVILLVMAAWPRPKQWADRTPCGTYCVHASCPRFFKVKIHNYQFDNTAKDYTDESTKWSVAAFNDAQAASCVLDLGR